MKNIFFLLLKLAPIKKYFSLSLKLAPIKKIFFFVMKLAPIYNQGQGSMKYLILWRKVPGPIFCIISHQNRSISPFLPQFDYF